MSISVIDRAEQQQTLSQLGQALLTCSQESEQVRIDGFLDQINNTKQRIIATTASTVSLSERLRGLFEFREVVEPELAKLGLVLDQTESLSRQMVDTYVKANRTYSRLKLSRTGLREYKEAADLLKEVAVDLRHRFFDLPQDAEFNDLLRQLHELG